MSVLVLFSVYVTVSHFFVSMHAVDKAVLRQLIIARIVLRRQSGMTSS